jgi:peptidoglycan/xylan/chitin deacetylase (PgdA/CDA1 family)
LAIGAYARAMTAGGLDTRRIAALGREAGVVLNLHSVSSSRRSLSAPLSPETFDALVRWLARHFRVRTFQDLSERDDDDPRPFAVLSFDDGYRDFLDYAMPILEQHGVRANQNVVPGCVESGLPPWNVLLLDRLGGLPPEKLRAIHISGFDASPPGLGHEERLRFGVVLSRFLKMRPRRERLHLVDELTAQLGDHAERPARPMLSKTELAEVARHHEVGLHSYEHDSMGFESDEFFRHDTDRCLSWSAEHLPTTPAVYAFPNGSYRESQIRIARASGFQNVLLVGEKASHVGARVHPRITVDGRNAREVRMRIARAR